MQLACCVLAREEFGAIVGKGVVVDDGSDFEVVAERRVFKVAFADGRAVLERETTSDSAKLWLWGCFGFELGLSVEGVSLAGFPAIVAFFPLSLEVLESTDGVSRVV